MVLLIYINLAAYIFLMLQQDVFLRMVTHLFTSSRASVKALIASHSSLNCSRLPSSVSVSFISSRRAVVQKNRGPLEPVERNSNPIRLEHCSPPRRLSCSLWFCRSCSWLRNVALCELNNDGVSLDRLRSCWQERGVSCPQVCTTVQGQGGVGQVQ